MKVKLILGALTLRSFGVSTKHEVTWIPDYGVTCSSLFTSNGSLGVTARGLESRLDVVQVREDIRDRYASLVIDGKPVVAGQVESALQAACAKADEKHQRAFRIE